MFVPGTCTKLRYNPVVKFVKCLKLQISCAYVVHSIIFVFRLFLIESRSPEIVEFSLFTRQYIEDKVKQLLSF